MSRSQFTPEPHNVIQEHQAYNDVKGRVNVILSWQYGQAGYDVKLLVIDGVYQPGRRPLRIVWRPWTEILKLIETAKLQPMPL